MKLSSCERSSEFLNKTDTCFPNSVKKNQIRSFMNESKLSQVGLEIREQNKPID